MGSVYKEPARSEVCDRRIRRVHSDLSIREGNKGGENIVEKDEEQSEFPTPSSPKIGEVVEATVVRGYFATGEEIFGEDARDPEQKRLVIVLSLGKGQDEIERSLPWRDPAGPKTSLGKIKALYGSFPRKGMKLKLAMGDSSWEIAGIE